MRKTLLGFENLKGPRLSRDEEIAVTTVKKRVRERDEELNRVGKKKERVRLVGTGDEAVHPSESEFVPSLLIQLFHDTSHEYINIWSESF